MPLTRDFYLAFLLLGLQLCLGSSFDGFRWQQNFYKPVRVPRDIQWECSTDAECTAMNSSCVNGQCQCTPGYVYNADRTTCLKAATTYEDECTETVQCSAYLFSGARCVNNACVCAPGYHYLHGRCYPSVGLHEKCRSDDECFVNAEFGAVSCKNGICECNSGFYQREYRTCRRVGKKIGDDCTVDVDCKFHENAFCNSKLVCDLKEEEGKKHIVSLANVVDNSSIVSPLTNQVNNEVGSSCMKNSDCSSLGNAVCHSTGTCVCDRAYFASEDNLTCIPELGEPCDPKDKPLAKDFVCRDNIWSCKKGMGALRSNRVCKKVVKKYNFSCKQDEQCNIFGPDAVCNKRCLCNERSHLVEDELFCWMNKAVDEECRHDNDCYMHGFSGTLVCEENVCRCPNGKHLNSNKTACIDSQSKLGMICDVNDDCITANSACVNNICTCKQHYYEKDGTCFLGLNGKCTENSDCTPRNSVCQETCSCKENFTALFIDTCTPLASLGEPCQYDVQCNSKTPRAICKPTEPIKTEDSTPSVVTEPKNGVCDCEEGYHFRFGKCFEKKVLGERCTSLGECYLETNLWMVNCMNEECKCTWGYREVNKTLCTKIMKRTLPGNGSAFNVPSAVWLVIMLLVLKLTSFA